MEGKTHLWRSGSYTFGLRNFFYDFCSFWIVYLYAYVSGLEVNGDRIILRDISGLTVLHFGILFFGVLGGFEIGRYVQTEFAKRRKKS